MNFFCFSLEGSPDVSDPPYEPTCPKRLLEDLVPAWQQSPPLLEGRGGRRGSDPGFDLEQPWPHTARVKRRSHVPTSSSANEKPDLSGADPLYWRPLREARDLVLQRNHHSQGTRPSQSCVLSVDDGGEQLSVDRGEKHYFTQGVNFEAWNPNYERSDNIQLELAGEAGAEAEVRGSPRSIQRLRRIRRLVRVKRGGQRGPEEGKSSSEGALAGLFQQERPVVAYLGLSQKAEPSPLHQRAEESRGRPWSSGAHNPHWSPSEGPPLWDLYPTEPPPPWEAPPTEAPLPWDPSLQTGPCSWAQHWSHGSEFSPPPASDWACLESLVQERDSLTSDPTHPRVVRSITDLDVTTSRPTSAGGGSYLTEPGSPGGSGLNEPGSPGRHRLTQPGSPGGSGLTQPGSPGTEPGSGPTEPGSLVRRTKMADLQLVTVSSADRDQPSEETDSEEGGGDKAGGGQPVTRGCGRSSDSLHSLSRLSSGRSSSSGVTSASEGSSDRSSPRPEEEEVLFTSLFCSRARVHTAFVPSPYDTESLTLKVGDVIDVISKPPMGIWTGRLKDRVGNFKFIYVDLLEGQPVPPQKMRSHSRGHKPRPRTLQGLMEHLRLEYTSVLPLKSYQTVEELRDLREPQREELRGTGREPEHRGTGPEPEHGHLWQTAAQHDRQKESEDKQESICPRADLNNYPRETKYPTLNTYPRDSGCYTHYPL